MAESPPGLDRPAWLGGASLVVGGIFSGQLGAAVASLVFPRVGALGVVTLRLVLSAVLLLAACRPSIRGHQRSDWLVVAAFGVALASMNGLFYQAIDRMPLGAAVTLEVLGPLALSVIAGRRLVDLLWAASALAGVVVLGSSGLGGVTVAGAAFALGAAAMWAFYILLSARAGGRFPRLDGLALAMAVGGVIALPFGIADAGTRLISPYALAVGAAIAVLSSALPYSLELLSLRRLPSSTFAMLMSLAPAVAALVGYLVLGQAIGLAEAVAIALVVAASAGAVTTSRPPPVAVADPL